MAVSVPNSTTGSVRARNFVGKVNVTRCIDHVQDVLLIIDSRTPGQTDRLGFNGDSAFAFNIHAIQILGTHIALFYNLGDSEHAIGQRGFTVIDMRNDTEIADLGRIGQRRLWCFR